MFLWLWSEPRVQHRSPDYMYFFSQLLVGRKVWLSTSITQTTCISFTLYLGFNTLSISQLLLLLLQSLYIHPIPSKSQSLTPSPSREYDGFACSTLCVHPKTNNIKQHIEQPAPYRSSNHLPHPSFFPLSAPAFPPAYFLSSSSHFNLSIRFLSK